jgi:hypothetical protein
MEVPDPEVLDVLPGTVVVVATELDVSLPLVVEVTATTSTGRALTWESAKLTICQVTAVVIRTAAPHATTSFQVLTG